MLSQDEKDFINTAHDRVIKLTEREMSLMIWASREGGRGEIKDGADQFNKIIQEVSIFLLGDE